MTGAEQSARLANLLAHRIETQGTSSVTEYWFYHEVLERDSLRHDIKQGDPTLLRQAQYAADHFTPSQLRRQAEDLLAN